MFHCVKLNTICPSPKLAFSGHKKNASFSGKKLAKACVFFRFWDGRNQKGLTKIVYCDKLKA